MSQPTEIHKHAARMIWMQNSTIDIVSELQNRFDILGDEKERELYIRVGQLRAMIKEARDIAPSAARKLLEDGHTQAEVCDILVQPFLLSRFEVDGIVSRAAAELANHDSE